MIACPATHHDDPVAVAHDHTMCRPCIDTARRNLRALPNLHADLAVAKREGIDAPQVSGTREKQLPIYVEAFDHARLIHDALAEWADTVASERTWHPPMSWRGPLHNVTATAWYLITAHEWTTAQTYAVDYVANITDLHGTARRLTTPMQRRPPRAAPVAPCPRCETGDALLWHVTPGTITCAVDTTHTWDQHAWPTLRRDIARTP